MGRSPCYEEVSIKKGPWTPEEDQKLLAYIEQHGHGSWRYLPAKAGLQRCGKSCRLRWINYLRPDIKRGKFSLQEEKTIIQLHALLGNRWSAIATHLPKRTDNDIKNYWNTHIKKRLTKLGIDPVTHKPKTNAFGSAIGHSKDSANLSHVAQWERARLEAEARLVKESKLIVSNPHPQLGERSTTTTTTTSAQQLTSKASRADAPAAGARPQCLDVLKAWQGVVSRMFGVGCRDNLESPTSTLSFNEHVLGTPPDVGLFTDNNFLGNSIPGQVMRGLNDNLGNSTWLHEMTSYNTDVAAGGPEWFQQKDSSRAAENSNIMELGLSDDMIICDSGDQQQINSLTFNAESSNGNFGGNFDIQENNENYWNSVMNLVNASTTWSPVF